MPFDPTNWRQPKVTVLPPTIIDTGKGSSIGPIAPERGGGGPQRIRVKIEIVDRRAPAPKRRTGSLLGWLIVLLLVALAAHADNCGFRYEHWTNTNGWHGQTRQQGSTTTGRPMGRAVSRSIAIATMSAISPTRTVTDHLSIVRRSHPIYRFA
jgi:hypothetical protein